MALNARLFGAETVDIESDTVNTIAGTWDLLVGNLQNFTANGNRILTELDVTVPITASAVATLDVGTVTTMVPSSTVTITLSKSGKVVTALIPQFTLTAQSGAATTIILPAIVPAAYRPVSQTNFSAIGSNNAVNADLWAAVLTTGDIRFSIYSSAALTLPAGTKQVVLSWFTA
jgi:hypothetical protein